MNRLLVLLGCCWAGLLQAQPSYTLLLTAAGERLPRYQKKHSDTASLHAEAAQVLDFFHREGYLEAHLQRQADTTPWHFVIRLGELFRWSYLHAVDVPPAWWMPPKLEGRPFRWSDVQTWQANILERAENAGFPFAEVRLSELDIRDHDIGACLILNKGTAIRFDTLIYRMDTAFTIQKRFLMRYLGIVARQPFRQASVRQATDRLRSLPYLRLRDSVQVEFENDRAYLVLPLSRVRANRFDVLLGMLPDEQNPNRRFFFSGKAEIALHNPFGTGKYIYFSWQRIRPETQQLQATYTHPHIAGLPLTAHLNLHWLKEDSSFFAWRRYLRLSYPLPRGGTIGGILDYRSTRQLSLQPDIQDANLLSYGIHGQIQRTDRFFQPRRGYKAEIELRTGQKKRLNAPDSLPKTTPQIELQADFSRFVPLGRRTNLHLRAQGGWIQNQQLLPNDLFRIGGISTLRGFTENFFFTQGHAILTLEAQLTLDEGSYLFLFRDQAWLRTPSDTDTPSGTGLGLQLTTRGGIFSFVYALGGSRERPVGFNTANIHFGFVSRF